MYGKLLTTGVLAGALAGVVAAIFQFLFVIPIILEAELYESGARIHFSASGSPQSVHQSPAMGNDWQRHLLTVGFDVVTYVGFGLILAAIIMFARQQDVTKITPRTGLLFGLAGFVAVQFAPALGLPPELPGTIGTEVGPRQTWWLMTVVFSAAGLWMIAFGRSFWPAIGVVALLAPHIIGAPQSDTFWGVAPPELAAHFATISLGVAALGWAVLGAACGWFWPKED